MICINGDKQPIRKHFKEEAFTNHVVQLYSGDKIYLFSDGYYSQFGGEKGVKMQVDQFKELIYTNAIIPMPQQKEKLEKHLKNWMGEKHQQTDDILIIGFEVNDASNKLD